MSSHEGDRDLVNFVHKFPNPVKDRQLFNTWVYSIGGDILQLENNHIFKYRRVCHVHFEPKYWCRNNRLAKGAVSTKNMPGLSCSKFSMEKRALRPLQMSKPSTSKEPVPPHIYPQSSNIDVQMKENLAENDNLSKVAGSDINEGSVDHFYNEHMSEASCSDNIAYGTLDHQNKKMSEVIPNSNDKGSKIIRPMLKD
ncbi:hypothetical protein HF086_002888 [Spodoptera exigua]|uniref:THAP-type domain-containing protein n=1 Tax=Spodoptera exigua TaxID=7107 RepID=A0A922SCF9_SPOEX|nr:hypothetical protein HF086_002888 [Spodoptera exigua]